MFCFTLGFRGSLVGKYCYKVTAEGFADVKGDDLEKFCTLVLWV
jgi:hypothetical protein